MSWCEGKYVEMRVGHFDLDNKVDYMYITNNTIYFALIDTP